MRKVCSIRIRVKASDGTFPIALAYRSRKLFLIEDVRAALYSDSHLKVKMIRIFVSTGGHLGEDGGAVKVGSLEPMDIPEVKVHVLSHSP